MENNEKFSARSVDDENMESVSGGAHLQYLVCKTCGKEIRITAPMMGQYYNNNICPNCNGRLK